MKKSPLVLLVQLVLENSPLEEIEEVLDFCVQVGLPVTLEELGVHATGDELNEKSWLSQG